MTIVSKDEERLAVAIELAEAEFWESIAASYPEAETGDLSPACSIALSLAMDAAVVEWLQFNVDAPEVTKTAEVMLHRIEYYYRDYDDLELTDSDKEHIAYSISNGIREGELCTTTEVSPIKEEEVYGYWKINNNPDA